MIAWTNYNVDAALSWLREAEDNNWSVSELRKQIRLDQADKLSTLTIQSLNHAGLYQHINSLYSFVGPCDVDEDAPILDKLEEDARSLIKVISEKRNARTRELAIGGQGKGHEVIPHDEALRAGPMKPKATYCSHLTRS